MFKITNRHLYFLGAFFVFLFLGVSFCQAASLGETIGMWVVGGLITAIGSLVIWLTSLFSTLGYMILTWVTDPGFIKVPVVSNAFVRGVGLAITIPLANIVVFLSLVAIGVGTALRLNGYDARKTLLKLFAVALLINFVPLLCGVVIDITNILMNFFFGAGNSGLEYFNTQSKMASSVIRGMWGTAKGFADLTGGLLLASILLSVFNVLNAIIFVLFAVLFLMRYVALWVLVIIAPLMFSFMVLPATNNWWKSWSNKFLNWCFVGTIASFYLYLSQQMVALIAQGQLINSSGPGTKDLGVVEYLLASFVPVAFLYFGFFETLNGGALGSGAVINMAKGQARRLGAGTRKTITSKTKAGAIRVGKEGAKSSTARGMVGSLSNASKWGENKKGLTGWFQRAAGGTVAAVGGEKLGIQMADTRDKLMKENDEKVAKMTGREYEYALKHKALGSADKGSFLARGLESKDSDVKKAASDYLKDMDQKHYSSMIEEMQKEGNDKDAKKIALFGRAAKNYQPENIGIKSYDPGMKEWAENLKKAEKMEESWASAGLNSFDLKRMADSGNLDDNNLKKIWERNLGTDKQNASSEEKEKMWKESGINAKKAQDWVSNLQKAEKLDEKWEKAGWKTDEIKEWTGKEWTNQTEKMMASTSKEDIANFSSGFWKSKEANEAIMKFWGGDKIAEAAKNFGDSFVKDYSKKAEEKGPDWFAEKNPKAFVYLAGNPAQEAGFSIPGGYTDVKEVRAFIRSKKGSSPSAAPNGGKSTLVEAGLVDAQGRKFTEERIQSMKSPERKESAKETGPTRGQPSEPFTGKKEYRMPRGGETGPRGTSKKPPGGETGV